MGDEKEDGGRCEAWLSSCKTSAPARQAGDGGDGGDARMWMVDEKEDGGRCGARLSSGKTFAPARQAGDGGKEKMWMVDEKGDGGDEENVDGMLIAFQETASTIAAHRLVLRTG